MTASRTWYAGSPWSVAAGLLRSLLTVVLMMVVYYVAPLDRTVDARLAVWLVTGLAGLCLAVAWQARAIAVSDTPRLRAIEIIAVGLPFLLLLYASTYALMSHDDPASFTEVLSRTDALYFTVTVFSTVGFGDIAPVTETARVVTMSQMVVGLAAVGVVAKLLFGAVQHAVSAQEAARQGDAPPPAPVNRDEQPPA
jgi:voltage-gated potassium channel